MKTPKNVIGFEISVSARDDGTIEAAYFHFLSGEVAETREVEEDVAFADYDADGNLLGIEIIAPVRIKAIEKLVKGDRRRGFKKFAQGSLPHELVCQ
jgi:uncharacterized protein YuzE